jgi:molybdenum-dependent DNA-binding transcriptional regulator ModE
MHRHFDDVLLGSIELFCLAAEAGSFTAAANTAGVTPAAVSRSISRLEKRLGVRLFVRSTRSIRLTEGGRSYFEQCRGALNQLIEAERKVTGEQVQPSGTLRISAPTTYGHYRLLPLLPACASGFLSSGSRSRSATAISISTRRTSMWRSGSARSRIRRWSRAIWRMRNWWWWRALGI